LRLYLGIREVYFGCSNQRFGGNGSILSLNKDKYPSYGGYMAEECMKVL
jgi:tRNA-specific adenosine deaminase 2